MNFWNDWHDKATGQKTASERKAEAHDRNQRTEQSREQQDKYQGRGDQQAQDAGHGYDPAAISQHDNWSSWDHKHMKTMVDNVDVDGINSHGETWLRVGSKLSSSFEQFHSEVTTAVKGGWTGDAATAAATAPDGMAKWGKAMGAASEGTGSRMQQASTAAKQAQINMPDPVEFSWRRTLVNSAGGGFLGGLGGAALSGGKDAYDQHKEAQQAKQQAVDVMNRMYTQGYVEVDNTTPAFAAPDDDKGGVVPPEHRERKIIEWPAKPPPNHTGGGDHNGTDSTGSDNGNDRRTVLPTDPGRTDPSQFDPNDTHPDNPNLPTDRGRTDPSQFDPNGNHTGQGGVDPRTAHGAGGGGGMGGMPMMGGGGGLGGAGDSEYGGRGYGRGGAGMGAGSGSGASESGSGGRSGIGGSAAQEAMGGRGGAGRGGAGGMGGGRGGRKEEDGEHESPDYLVETDDVFGSGEMVAPPVIGES
ncbi:PPE domain-containing protein [Labedaea rhizosphaerae]|uniref:PPE family protein n=1 Tax=Labedaea rhizosphaerae TaxID=598644 RepID=A0A4R6SK86_LABRH|nr:PPE domain-containing protein [Labedaea rhizosphaerae]TDQ04271.1 PPE family protein [Labedaea rhizosphaerae]